MHAPLPEPGLAPVHSSNNDIYLDGNFNGAKLEDAVYIGRSDVVSNHRQQLLGLRYNPSSNPCRCILPSPPRQNDQRQLCSAACKPNRLPRRAAPWCTP